MTECSSESMSFSSVSRREVVADFLGGRLTSDAGGLLLKEVDRRIGLLDAINAEIPDPRTRKGSRSLRSGARNTFPGTFYLFEGSVASETELPLSGGI